MLLHHKEKLVLVRFIAETKIQIESDLIESDWEEAKQICPSNTITAGKQGKTSLCW